MSEYFRRNYPRLAQAIEGNIIRLSESKLMYVGRASDGEEVTLGSAHDPASLEHYLAMHPSPETW